MDGRKEIAKMRFRNSEEVLTDDSIVANVEAVDSNGRAVLIYSAISKDDGQTVCDALNAALLLGANK